ncbi:MAG: ABC transporter substrate-binding protein [Spirochaetales bacterium]|nr:ABC transporter substrate-binding protein [Spirochaetales bacterium]
MKTRNLIFITLSVLYLTATAVLFSAAVGETTIQPSNPNGNFLEFTDSYGRDVVIPKKPESIISLGPNATEIIFSLGRGQNLIGRTQFCDYPAETASIETIGNMQEPNIERIIELNPDLVIASTHVSLEKIKLLEKAGIPIVGIYNDSTFEGVYNTIRDIGKVLGETNNAERLIFEMGITISDVSKRVEGLDKPSVYYVVGFGDWGDFTAGGDTFINQMIEMAGGDNIASDVSGWAYSLEKIIEKDPEYIICSKFWGTKELFKATPNYKDLTAVKEGRLIAIDNNILDRQGYRNAEGVKILAQIFHPEAFK